MPPNATNWKGIRRSIIGAAGINHQNLQTGKTVERLSGSKHRRVNNVVEPSNSGSWDFFHLSVSVRPQQTSDSFYNIRRKKTNDVPF